MHMNVLEREADFPQQGNQESDGGHLRLNLQLLSSGGALDYCVELLLALGFQGALLVSFHWINET